jgi:hypothetical protein
VSRLAVDEPPERAGGRGPGADRDDRPDRHPGELHGREERELVDGDADCDGEHVGVHARQAHAEDARDGDEHRPAEHDPRGAHRDGRGGRPERPGGAGRAEADRREEDLRLGTHGAFVPQSVRNVKGGDPQTTSRPAPGRPAGQLLLGGAPTARAVQGARSCRRLLRGRPLEAAGAARA